MAGWLAKYMGYDVEVFYLTDSGTYRDRGRLTDFGDGWIEMVRDEALFLIPTTGIRLVKVLAPPNQPEQRLLRPSAAGDPHQPGHDDNNDS